jgi:hypothetical protein
VPFEGTITVTLVAPGHPMTFVIRVKGAKMRIDMPGDASYVIEDRAEQRGVTVSPERKTVSSGSFSRIPFDEIVQLTASADASIIATGQTDTVAGAICQVYRVREPHGDEHECCLVSSPFATEGASGDAGRPRASGAFSLRTIVKSTPEHQGARIEVTSIEEKALDASLFVVPASYRRVTEGLQR